MRVPVRLKAHKRISQGGVWGQKHEFNGGFSQKLRKTFVPQEVLRARHACSIRTSKSHKWRRADHVWRKPHRKPERHTPLTTEFNAWVVISRVFNYNVNAPVLVHVDDDGGARAGIDHSG
jgi:hypothetical protein